jgi:1-aminocyclopropane-1-carboxylate deaminase/D-cysteine desulfhydrase-like pyridoxal-dependent ACC family enzyme
MAKTPFMTAEKLEEALGILPRAPYAYTPTPLEECPRLSQALGGPRILIKRDDLTGLAFGGNKARHMEFRIGDAIAKGCDMIINTNHWVSNNARFIAAACAKVGMKYIFVARGTKERPFKGNLLLQHLLGATFYYLESYSRDEADAYCRKLAEEARKEGYTPYVSSDEPLNHYAGTLGYMECALELARQAKSQEIPITKVYLVAGSSMAGMLLGSKLVGLPWEVIGVWAGDRENVEDQIVTYSRQCQKLLKLPASIEPNEANVLFGYVGEGYTIPTPECIEAIRLVARTEAIILDPNYTGKAMAAMIDHIRKGIITSKDTIVFVHTGGTPELFSHADSLVI